MPRDPDEIMAKKLVDRRSSKGLYRLPTGLSVKDATETPTCYSCLLLM